MTGNKLHHIVIGNSASGVAAAEKIRELKPLDSITIVSEESGCFYSRCLLSHYISGKVSLEKVFLRDMSFYSKNSLKLMDSVKAIGIDTEKRVLVLENGKKLAWDKLLIATGASPQIPAFQGGNSRGVFVLRTLQHSKDILEYLEQIKQRNKGKCAQNAVIFGGGLVGMKAATALADLGLNVYVVIKSNRILSQMIDREASEILEAFIAGDNFRFLKGVEPTAVECGSGFGYLIVHLDSGEKINTNIVIVGKGVKANTEIIESSGIKANRGIAVDEWQMTTAQNVYASGDVAETVDIATGKTTLNALWPCAVEQGIVAGQAMADYPVKYKGSMSMNSIEISGIPIISAGKFQVQDDNSDVVEIVYNSKADGFKFRKVMIEHGFLKGFIVMGNIREAGLLMNLIKNRILIENPLEIFKNRPLLYHDILPLLPQNQDPLKGW